MRNSTSRQADVGVRTPRRGRRARPHHCRESETLYRRERAAIIVIPRQARRLICWYLRGEWAKQSGSVLTSL
jgi:hypothetical protein